MPRVYLIKFKNVAISAAQDLVAIKGATGKIVRVRRVWLGMTDTTIQTAQGLNLNIKYGSATVTLGSGGSGPTPTPVDPGDSAASFTARVNDTTPATTSGAFTDLIPNGVHNYGGWEWAFPRDAMPPIGVNEGCIFELLSTVTGTCHFSGGMEVEESGG